MTLPGPSTQSCRQLEWFCGLLMLACSAVLAVPGDSLSTPSFEPFHRFGMTESFWTFVFGFVGAGRLVALYINGRSPRTPYARMSGAFLGLVTWAQMTVVVAQGTYDNYNALSLGVAIFGMLAGAELYSVHRAAYDARYASR